MTGGLEVINEPEPEPSSGAEIRYIYVEKEREPVMTLKGVVAVFGLLLICVGMFAVVLGSISESEFQSELGGWVFELSAEDEDLPELSGWSKWGEDIGFVFLAAGLATMLSGLYLPDPPP